MGKKIEFYCKGCGCEELYVEEPFSDASGIVCTWCGTILFSVAEVKELVADQPGAVIHWPEPTSPYLPSSYRKDR